MADDIAGCPVSLIRWSRRSTCQLSKELKENGLCACPNSVAKILKDNRFSLKANRKSIAETYHPDRNKQFEIIAEIKKRFEDAHYPIISVDSKKKELIGNYKTPARPGARIMKKFLIMIFALMPSVLHRLLESLNQPTISAPFLWGSLMIPQNSRWTALSNG